mgnify:CR=1 FL=1
MFRRVIQESRTKAHPVLVGFEDREIAASLTSIRGNYPGRKLTAIFQPHLYTRTRDFAEGFAEALSHADRLILLDIYPAREEPIEGVVSEIIGELITVPWRVVERESLAQALKDMDTDIVVTFGAGNIDAYCSAVAEVIERKSL